MKHSLHFGRVLFALTNIAAAATMFQSTAIDTSPEAREAFEEIAGFFDKHLGK